jgi:uncharacterized protein
MFGIPSFPKLIVLAAIIAVIWYGFRLVGELDKARRQAARVAKQAGQKGRSSGSNVEETVKCRACGAYVPAREPSRCNRSECPF